MTKQHILSEIKRTASANGGAPLGWKKFITETGIAEAEWKGKLWARWSDAIKEAGFTPNEMVRAYGKQELLEKYAKLALEFGRLPTSMDIRLKIRHGVVFPDWATYARTFGTKRNFITLLHEHCKATVEFAALIPLCDIYLQGGSEVLEEPAAGHLRFGYVYLFKHGTRKHYKVGKTYNILKREGEIRIELPEGIVPIHTIKTDDPAGVEAYWHNRFEREGKQLNGEWYELTADDVKAFKRWRRIS